MSCRFESYHRYHEQMKNPAWRGVFCFQWTLTLKDCRAGDFVEFNVVPANTTRPDKNWIVRAEVFGQVDKFRACALGDAIAPFAHDFNPQSRQVERSLGEVFVAAIRMNVQPRHLALLTSGAHRAATPRVIMRCLNCSRALRLR